MSYRNVDNWQVILINGVRDPEVSWADHRNRTPPGLGGVDCVAAIGTPIHAPAAGRLLRIPDNGTGGNTLQLIQPDGWTDVFMHLDGYRFGESGVEVQQGELIGWTGNTSSDPVPPHLHWHRIDPDGYYTDQWGRTNRRNPWHYFSSVTGSGGGTTPIPGEIEMTYEEFRDFLSRALKYDAREFQASGPTIWERFAVLVSASRKADPTDETPVDGGVTGWIAFRNASWRFLKYHSRPDGPDGKARTVFEQLDAIEAAVKVNGTVKLDISDASAELIASKVAAKIGPSAL
jgi:hypothetical protein